MTITLKLSSDALAGLTAEATALGVTVEQLAAQALETRFTALPWQAQNALAAIVASGARPGQRVGVQALFAHWLKTSNNSPTNDLITGLHVLARLGLIEPFEDNANAVVFTQAGYDRLID